MRTLFEDKSKQPVSEIKDSTTIEKLESICKKSVEKEEVVRLAILRNLENDIARLEAIQNLANLANPKKKNKWEAISMDNSDIVTDIKSLKSLAKTLKSGDLATEFNEWKKNGGTGRSINDEISSKMLASIENIVQSSFIKSSAQEENSTSSILTLFQKNNQGSSSSSTENNPSSSFSSNSHSNNQTAQTFDKIRVFVGPECGKQILAAIMGSNDAHFIRYDKKNQTLIQSNLSSQDLLNELKSRMHEFEQFKHPNPPWDYSRLEPKNDKEKTIIKIDYDPRQAPKDLTKILAEKEANSLVVRQLSILCGALTLLDSPSFLTENNEKKQEIRNYITALSNDIISGAIRRDNKLDIKKNLESFINKLSADIGKIADIKKDDTPKLVSDPIRKAERYFTAEYNKDMVLIATTRRDDGSKVVQMDIEINQLDRQQRQEYLQIHTTNPPQWFANLMPSEKEWYQARVPKLLDDEQAWNNFEKLFKSSAMQHAPGLSNARANFGILQHLDGSVEMLTVGLQSGVPANYEMAQQEMEKHAIANIEQMRNIAIKLSEHNYQQLWGDFFGEYKPSIPILFQSLLSPATILSKADQTLIDAQSSAMGSVPGKLDYPNHNIMLHNNPTNLFRITDAFISNINIKKKAMKPDVNVSREDHNWDKMNVVRNDAKLFMSRIIEKCGYKLSIKERNAFETLTASNKPLAPEQKQALCELINSGRLGLTDAQHTALLKIIVAENECRKLEQTTSNIISRDVRNKEEYKIAIKRLLVEGMGGVIINNCKSGKDRTGLSEIYQHAMIHYFKKYGDINSYDADGVTRERFCEIINELYSSGKIQEAAGFNTPGSAGIKAPTLAGIFDDQIIKLLGELHETGCNIAGLNKPPQYTKLEKEQLKNKDIRAEVVVTSELKF